MFHTFAPFCGTGRIHRGISAADDNNVLSRCHLSAGLIEVFKEFESIDGLLTFKIKLTAFVSANRQDPNDNTFSLSLQERELYKSTNLTQSLTDVFTTIGETAYKAETPICFFIDEIQYMRPKELGSLIAALHRTNQLGYPVMIIGAGLPKIYKMLSEEKSYSERLFLYKEIGSLTEEQSRKATEEPRIF